ncbi:MAG: flagellar hook-length control protein FliK [Desulfamplus sp.]|nr:flagellar hook-length control protein FliK [Desulfamplus sp.]
MNFDLFAPKISTKSAIKAGTTGSLNHDSGAKDAPASNLFISKFKQILSKNGINHNGIAPNSPLDTTKSSTSTVDILADNVKNDLLKEMNKAEGFEFLTKLKQYLMASGHSNLKEVSIGQDGLDTLKIMLDKAGFPQSKVADLIKSLQSQSDDGKVFVSDLMDGLLALEPETLADDDLSAEQIELNLDKIKDIKDNDSSAESEDESLIVQASAIPFISSIMKSLGIPDDVIKSTLASSEVKGRGLNLNTFINDLQSLQKTSFFTGKSFENASDIETINGLLNQLGLESTDSKSQNSVANNGAEKGTFTLGGFVSALESLRQKNSIKDVDGSSQKVQQGAEALNDLNNSKFELPNGASLNVSKSDSDELINKLMGDLHIKESAKESEKNQPTETDIRYRTMRSATHDFLMNLSASGETDSAKKSSLNLDGTSDKDSKDKEIKELLSSLGINLKSKSEITSNANTESITSSIDEQDLKSGDLKETLTSLDVLSKNSLDRTKSLKNVNQTDSLNPSPVNNQVVQQEQQNVKDGTTIATSASVVAENIISSKVASELSSLINNSDALNTGKRDSNRRSGYNENEFDALLSRSEKRQSLNISDSNQSGGSGSFLNQGDSKGSSLGASTNRTTSSILPSYVTNQVVRSINRSISSGENEIRLQLRPAELGRIFMTIETQGDVLKVNIVTENQAAKDILTGHAEELKSSLSNNGINIESFNVEMGSDFKQSMANSGQQQQNGEDSSSRGLRANSSSSVGESEGEVSPILENKDGDYHFIA